MCSEMDILHIQSEPICIELYIYTFFLFRTYNKTSLLLCQKHYTVFDMISMLLVM